MTKDEIIQGLMNLRKQVDLLIEHARRLDDEPGGMATVTPTTEAVPQQTPESDEGLLGAMELGDTLKDVYLYILKNGDVTVEELGDTEEFKHEDTLAVIVKTLFRQGYLERVKEDGQIKYYAKAGQRKSSVGSTGLWDKLEGL